MQDALAEHITARDRLALEYLTDVRAVHGKDGSVVELHFASNPFFSNKVLKRGGVNAAEEEGGSPLSEIWTDIDWKEGKNLTIKVGWDDTVLHVLHASMWRMHLVYVYSTYDCICYLHCLCGAFMKW